MINPFMMKVQNIVKNLRQTVNPLAETLNEQVTKPILDEAAHELRGFLGLDRRLSQNPKEIAGEDLKRARDKQKLEEMSEEDEKSSQEATQQVHTAIKEEYRLYTGQTSEEQIKLKSEFRELQEEVAKLAQAADVKTDAHLETVPKKVGILDIKRLTRIIKLLRIKAEESKSAKELVAQRSNAKRATGMLAWVYGKQMKIHEQGTLQLQG